MRHRSTIAVCLSILIFTASRIFAIDYSFLSLENSQVTIKYNLNKMEISSPPPDRKFVFACACYPGITFNVNAVAKNEVTGATAALDAKIIRSGQAGPDYLIWIAFSPYKHGSAIEAMPQGTITINFSSAIMSKSISKARIKSTIIYPPLLQSSVKKHSNTAPVSLFDKGVKFGIDADGIYEITAVDLQKAGVPVGSISSRTFRLFCQNAETPIYITNSQHTTMQTGDKILFYGTFLRGTGSYHSQFSNTNVYWLTWSGSIPGIRITEVSGAQQKDARQYQQQLTEIYASDFYDTVHIEEDNDIRWLGDISTVQDIGDSPDTGETIDNWYWGIIGANYSTSFTFSLPAPSGSQTAKARMRIGLIGLTSNASVTLDHNLAVTLNDKSPGDTLQIFRWKGQTTYTFESDPFPVSRIQSGNNVLSFLCQSSFADMSALNWVEIEYYRTFAATGDKLWFKTNPLDTGAVYEFDISGFSDSSLDLWDIGSHRIFTGFDIQKTTVSNSTLYKLVFQDSLATVNSYFAQTSAKRLKPASMVMDTLRSGWDTLANADYMAVTVDSFIPDLKPLAEAYAKRGLSVAVVDVSDVYNSFSAGIHDPESIRSLLRYIFSLGKSKLPKYLLLGGDTTHDLDKNRREKNIIPTHLSRVPGWGPSSNDGYFATLENDNFPALCVGRFPAENKTQMQTMVSKTVKYLNYPEPGFWRDNLLMLGGWENDFTTFNNTVSSQVIGSGMSIYRMDADTGSIYYKNEFVASKTIADYINAGVYAINFNGHGGGNIWSDSKFFGYDDLDGLYNGQWGKSGKLPFVFSFTCLTGFFESAFYRSLGEEFLRKNSNGALCFLGASAYTSKQANGIMNRILLDHAVNNTVESVGELVRYTKMEMLARYGVQYLAVVRQYNLLGDPALPWALAPDSLKISLADSSIDSHDSLMIKASCAPIDSGQARITVIANDKKWDDRIKVISKSVFTDTIATKDPAKASYGEIHAFAWNDSRQLRGSLSFSKSSIPVLNVKLDKDTIRFGDTVYVSCTYNTPATAVNTAMLCLYALSTQPPTSKSAMSNSVSMLQNNGTWTSGPVPLVYTGSIGDILFIKFRISYSDETTPVSDTTRTYSFNIEGRPDLIFTNDTLRPSWSNDSLKIVFQLLNSGNAVAPPFRTFFYWGKDAAGDTIRTIYCADSLLPGKTKTLSVAIPDTQGSIKITACINAGHSFQEISFDNNSRTMELCLNYGDMTNTSDSLFSEGKGLCILPLKTFSQKRRIFLVSKKGLPSSPLKTESSWVTLRGDSLMKFSIGARPPLSGNDSLTWIFFRDTASLHSASTKNASGKLSAFFYDSSFALWRYSSGNGTPSDTIATIHSQLAGPISLGLVTDTKAPQIRAYVDGREITFLDYAAKDKPFNIQLNDASGILSSSIKISLNNKILDSLKNSASSGQTALTDVTVTAYPYKENLIDTLSVYAEDLAGNAANKTFAYMPGEDLKIRFFSCHPNPFSAAMDAQGSTIQTIRFAFLLTDAARDVSIKIYTIKGRAVWKWESQTGTIGYQEVEWNGRTSNGYRIANGTYYAKLTAANS
ncbi:MAG TPA: hypothetical protein DCO75_08660, partial [Fibrobacteres bacterium]|nr:hypothetical protein [Fibrobacterota bacterium]